MSLFAVVAQRKNNIPTRRIIWLLAAAGITLYISIISTSLRDQISLDTMNYPYTLVKATLISILAIPQFSIANFTYTRPSEPDEQLAINVENALKAGKVIPGGSPFSYLDDPAGNIFAISMISMTPNPCYIGATCALEVSGTFSEPAPDVKLNMDIDMRIENGERARIIAVDDDLCSWAEVQQGGKNVCPNAPIVGPATIAMSVDLVQGYVNEALYYIDLKLISGDKKLTHIGAKIDLKKMMAANGNSPNIEVE